MRITCTCRGLALADFYLLAQASIKGALARICCCPVFILAAELLIAATDFFACADNAMSALLENLKFRPETNQVNNVEDLQSTEGKFGIPRFDGNPNSLQEHTYRVKTKSRRSRDEQG